MRRQPGCRPCGLRPAADAARCLRTLGRCRSIAFIGGGNMASAHVGGLVGAGSPARGSPRRRAGRVAARALGRAFGVARARRGRRFARLAAELVVWAVKPQIIPGAAAAPCETDVGSALHLSVMAGIRSDAIAARRRHRARRARHAQHAGADRPGHRRPVRAAGRDRRGSRRRSRPCCSRPARSSGSTRKPRSTRSPRSSGSGPGLRLPPARSDARGGAARWACPSRCEAARAANAGRRRGAGRGLRRSARRRCAATSPRPAARRTPRWRGSRRPG